jgi:hypothetical protein
MQGYGLFGRSDASTPAGIVRTHRKTRICPVASWKHECFAVRRGFGDCERRKIQSQRIDCRSSQIAIRHRSPTLPNGRSVIVRVNDRGPCVRGRAVDVVFGR